MPKAANRLGNVQFVPIKKSFCIHEKKRQGVSCFTHLKAGGRNGSLYIGQCGLMRGNSNGSFPVKDALQCYIRGHEQKTQGGDVHVLQLIVTREHWCLPVLQGA